MDNLTVCFRCLESALQMRAMNRMRCLEPARSRIVQIGLAQESKCCPVSTSQPPALANRYKIYCREIREQIDTMSEAGKAAEVS